MSEFDYTYLFGGGGPGIPLPEGPDLRCGAHDNDNPHLECGLPIGHQGPHVHRPSTPELHDA